MHSLDIDRLTGEDPLRCSGRVLEAVLYRGNLARSAVPSVAGASTRTATRIVSALTEAGVLISDTLMRRYVLLSPPLWRNDGCPDFSPKSENDGSYRNDLDVTGCSGCRIVDGVVAKVIGPPDSGNASPALNRPGLHELMNQPRNMWLERVS